jgi:WD40 repeat protein
VNLFALREIGDKECMKPHMPTDSQKVFYCYAREDEQLQAELEKHLKRYAQIVGWHDRKIGPGQSWEDEIDSHLNSADIILLLITPDFLASDYCYGSEMKRALERQTLGEARIVPILLRPTYYKDAPFSDLPLLPKSGKAVTLYPNQDEAFVEIAVEIQSVVEELTGEQQPPVQSYEKSPLVFLAYARADEEFVARFKVDLRKQGIQLWIDQEALQPGTPDWEEAVRSAIRTADAILLIASPSARSSRYVKDQLRIAEMYQRPIYPIWIDGNQWMEAVPLGLGGMQYIDARRAQYRSAIQTVTTLLQAPFPKSPQTGQFDFEPRNPYKGLRPFSREDAGDFFGHNALIRTLLDGLEMLFFSNETIARLLAVIGPSGSGKSSVVMAGLLPYLQDGALPGSKEWLYLTPLTPGKQPLEALTLVLSEKLSDRSLKSIREDLEDESQRGLHLLATHLTKQTDTKVLLFVDQLEEVFTLTTSEEERRQFIDLLLTAVTEPNGPLLLIFTLRADFYDRLTQYPEFALIVEENHQLVLPMDIQDLRAVIKQPAELPDVQLLFEDDLIGDLLFEVRGQVGVLPLLQFTLDQLFQQRSGHLLTVQAYQQLGGVKGALTRHAETVYENLPSEKHHQLTRALFLRLIDPGATEQEITRRRATLFELTLPDPVETQIMGEVADAFVGARLLIAGASVGKPTLEVSHEALIQEWTLLQGWIRVARNDILFQKSISEDAQAWILEGELKDRHYRGARLLEAQAWADRNIPSQGEMKFIHASIQESEREKEERHIQQIRELGLQRRATNRLRILVVALSIFLVVAVVLSSVAAVSGQNAIAEKDKAITRQSELLAAQAQSTILAHQPDKALLLAVKALQVRDTYRTRSSLLETLEYSSNISKVLKGHTTNSGVPSTGVSSLVFEANNQELLSAGAGDGSVIQWDTKTGSQHSLDLPPFRHHYGIFSIALSHDGRFLASAGFQGVWIWDARTGRQLAEMELATSPYNLDFNVNPLWQYSSRLVGFSPDSNILVTARCVIQPCEAGKGQITFWNVASWKPIRTLDMLNPITSFAFSRDGKKFAASSCATYAPQSLGCSQGLIQIWDTATGTLVQHIVGHHSQVLCIDFSPDGNRIVSGGEDASIILWDISKGEALGKPFVGHSEAVTRVAFDLDGKRLFSSSTDTFAAIWDVGSSSLISWLSGHNSPIISLALSSDGQWLATGDKNNSILLWNLSDEDALSHRLWHEGSNSVKSVAFSPDSKLLAIGDLNGKVVIRDANTKAVKQVLLTYKDQCASVTGTLVDYSPCYIENVIFSGDGKKLIASARNGRIFIWDVSTWRSLGEPMKREVTCGTFYCEEAQIRALALNPDDTTLVVGGCASSTGLMEGGCDQGQIQVWDLNRKQLVFQLNGHKDSITAIAFSPAGKLLVSGSSDGSMIFWDLANKKNMAVIKISQFPEVVDLAFLPGGKTLASYSSDGVVRFWDVSTQKEDGQGILVSGENISSCVRHPVATKGGDQQDMAILAGPYGSLAFSPDGKLMVTGTCDHRVALWDVATRKALFQPFTDPDQVNSVAFSPDGKFLVSGDDSGFAILWNYDLHSWIDQACHIANRNFTLDEVNQFSPDDLQVCKEISVEPSVIEAKLYEAGKFFQAHDFRNSSAAYTQASQWAVHSSLAELNNRICAEGSVHKFAREVLPSCERAVSLSPRSGRIADSRGLARALIGDYTGAAQDFAMFIQWIEQNKLDYNDYIIPQRQHWIMLLKKGVNPFDDQTLKQIEADYVE